jgi:hypothetical protein
MRSTKFTPRCPRSVSWLMPLTVGRDRLGFFIVFNDRIAILLTFD